MTPKSFGTPLTRLSERARMPCGYALATAGHDTRALEAWLGHKNIQHTVRYTELAPDRFKDFSGPVKVIEIIRTPQNVLNRPVAARCRHSARFRTIQI